VEPLGASAVRQIHWILSGALSRAIPWRWIAVNPASQAEPPALPRPPQPPSPTDAAAIIKAARRDPDWGALVWFAMRWAAHSQLPALAKTIRKHRDAIHNTLHSGLSNARVEANNTHLRVLTEQSHRPRP
jgi:hypothetical protein